MDTKKIITILIADDDPDIIEFLTYNLEQHGFKVLSCNNGKDVLHKASTHKPDLILLDIMMPGLDGIEVCNELRNRVEFENTIIAFLTARGEDYSQIAGFEVGADDYITKPIKPKLLIARLQALLKRNRNSEESKSILQYANLQIDSKKRVVQLENTTIHFPKKEFDILLLLASKPEIVFTREEIYKKIWGSDIYVGDRTIDVHMRKIREKIGENFIYTIKGIGYKFMVK